MNFGDEGVAAAIEASGDCANGAVAAKAIPNCNIVYIAGADMQATVEGFFEALYGVAPQSIGGALPGKDFSYIGE